MVTSQQLAFGVLAVFASVTLVSVAMAESSHSNGATVVVPTPQVTPVVVSSPSPTPAQLTLPTADSAPVVASRSRVTPKSNPIATPSPASTHASAGATVDTSTIPATVTLPSQAQAEEKKKSGVNGRIFIDAGCPVVEIRVDELKPDQDCEMKPFQSTIVIINTDTSEYIGEIASDPQGHFKLELAPGNYLIKENVDYFQRPMMWMPMVSFQVVEGEYTDVSVFYDSGIR